MAAMVGLLFLFLLAVALFVAWLAAKGFPRSWDRDTFVLAFPVLLFVGGGGFYIAQRWNPIASLPFLLKEVLGYASLTVVGISWGCVLAIFSYGRLVPKHTGSQAKTKDSQSSS